MTEKISRRTQLGPGSVAADININGNLVVVWVNNEGQPRIKVLDRQDIDNLFRQERHKRHVDPNKRIFRDL